MKKLVKVLAIVMAVALAVTAFAACGRKEDDVTTTAPAADGTVAAEGTTAAAAKAVKVININLTDEEYALGVDKAQPELLAQVNEIIKQVKEDGTLDAICNNYFGDGTPVAVQSAALDESKDQLVVATNAAFEPFEYTKGADYYGIDMELASYIAKKLGKELVIQNMEFDAVCLSVGQHKCDIAMAGLTVKPDREEYVTFSESYYQASQKIVVKGSDTTFDACDSVADVEAILNSFDSSVKIGAQSGTTGQFYVEGDESFGFAGLKATCVGYKTGSLAVQDLTHGGVDYVIIDSAPAACIANAINEMA